MKRIQYLLALSLAFVATCRAASCVSGSLASYINLGTGGCTIGGNTVASFKDLSGAAFNTEIASTAITIAPSGGSYNPGLSASVNNMTAPSGTVLEMMFTYTISGPTYVAENITLSGASESGGAVYEAQNYCEAGTFGSDGVDGCTGTFTGTLATADGFGNADSAVFDPPHFVSITEDLFIDSTFGSATGGKITDQFTAVPEPGAFVITGIGFALLVCKSRFRACGRFEK